MTKRVLLIDGDQFVFKAAIATETETQWDDQNHVLHSNYNKAWDLLTDMLDRIFDRFETKEHALCFSEDPNFRKEIDPSYKAGRAARKPLCYARMREAVESHYTCVAMLGLEADDVMGILATKPGKTQRIIVSQDKDMRTIPTTVWNGKDTFHVTEAEADYFHLYQTLIGDTCDGYKGCPGIGPKGAVKLLTDGEFPVGGVDVMWPRVLAAYTKAGLTEEDALRQARLARILRWTDWDGKKKEPILWTPNQS